MTLHFLFDEPFTDATKVDKVNLFTTTGLTATFPVTDIARVGSTIQYSSTLKRLYNGGFTKNSNNTVTLDTTPAAGLQGAVNGLQSIISTTYDNTTQVANGNIKETAFYVGNIENPQLVYHIPQTGASGIQLFFTNNITGAGGADLTWVQLACANSAGAALTYQATGTTLYTANMSSFSTVAASSAQGATTISVVNAQAGFTFWAGDFLHFNFGQNNAEILRLSSISIGATATTLTMAGSFNYTHAVAEPVYFCARKFWMKHTTPIGFTNNQATNYYNISIDAKADEQFRP